VHNVKKAAKEAHDNLVSLPEKHSRLIERGYAGMRTKTIDFGRGRRVKSALRVKKTPQAGATLQGMTLNVPEAIDGR